MRLLLLGVNGQLGRDLAPRLSGTVLPCTRAQMDLERPETVRPCLDDLKPDVVINCAAYNFVDKAESEPEAAFKVNAWGVRELALACAERHCLLVHFSTDFVYGIEVDRRIPFTERDAPGPVNVYGMSKLCGEYLVRTHCPDHLIIRTCGLYGVWGSGGKGTNFVEAILRRAASGQPLRVVNDQVCTPSYTVDVAQAVVALLEREVRGIVHVTNGGSCTWWELARDACRLQGLVIDIQPISSKEYGAAARRPAYSVLDNVVIRDNHLPELRPWQAALAAYLMERGQKK